MKAASQTQHLKRKRANVLSHQENPMTNEADTKPGLGPCNPACTKIVQFMTDQKVPPSAGRSLPPYTEIDRYRFINIFVKFTQNAADEPPVDLGLVFAFDRSGTMATRRYVIVESNLSGAHSTDFIEVSGKGSWHGNPHNISSYLARLPVMGPFVQIFVYNRAPIERTVSVWGYLLS